MHACGPTEEPPKACVLGHLAMRSEAGSQASPAQEGGLSPWRTSTAWSLRPPRVWMEAGLAGLGPKWQRWVVRPSVLESPPSTPNLCWCQDPTPPQSHPGPSLGPVSTRWCALWSPRPFLHLSPAPVGPTCPEPAHTRLTVQGSAPPSAPPRGT